MNIPSSMPRLKGYRFPREIVAYAVWVYHRITLNHAGWVRDTAVQEPVEA